MKRLAISAVLAAVAALGTAEAKCDYGFSGQVTVVHNGIERPMPDVKVRVRRENGTGLGRDFVRTDKDGKFSGTWSFDKDQNGKLPGSEDINFAIQIKLEDHDRFKVVKGGWTDTPWDTIQTTRGKDCIPFIFTEPFRLNADGDNPSDLARRAYIYMVHSRLLKGMEAEGVGLKNRIEVIYPERHVYSAVGIMGENSWFMQKSHIVDDDWDNTRTLIHEVMHQWDVNWMQGEKTLTCLFDGHHKPPQASSSKNCSGFMEGFAEASARALFNALMSNDRFYSNRSDRNTFFQGPQSHEALRTDTDQSGSVQNTGEAQRNDDGWRNFLQFMMWDWSWDLFDTQANPDLYELSDCKPLRIPVFDMLRALKAEAPDHGGDRATFNWFTNILEDRITGFSSDDMVFYQLLGNPAADPVDIQKNRCPEQRATLERFTAPLRRPDASQISSSRPQITPGTKVVTPGAEVIKPKGFKD